MKTYEHHHRSQFIAAFFCTFASSLIAVALQFLNGDVLDFAAADEAAPALRSGGLLLALILSECLFYYLFERFSAKYAIGCFRDLRRDIFGSILRRDYVSYKAQAQGEYIAKFTAQAEAIRDKRFQMQTRLWEILLKILFVTFALFRLDWRIAVVTLFLPLANLDDPTARRIEDLLLSIPNKTMIVVTHQFSPEKLSAFDRVIDMNP